MLRAFLLVLASITLIQAQKVDVKFYGESLCPYCAGFTTTVLKDIFSSEVSTIVNFSYIGWGNVNKIDGNYHCQHGPLECRMNTVLNCGQNLSSTQEQFFNFLYCIESQVSSSVEDQIPGCAKGAGIALSPLEDCYKGEGGRKLDRQAMRATNRLEPPHTYVPWVTVNDQPIFDSTVLLRLYICAAYMGEKPKACAEPPPSLQ